MYNETKYAKSVKHGLKAEEKFKRIATTKNFNVQNSTIYQNKIKHIDFILCKNSENGLYKRTVDVKGVKKINSEFTDKLIFIELQNNNGGTGWLYGDVDGFAFEMMDGSFILVNRIDLVAKVESLIDVNKPSITTVTKKQPYVIYDRKPWDNDDRIVLITQQDLLSLKHSKWR